MTIYFMGPVAMIQTIIVCISSFQHIVKLLINKDGKGEKENQPPKLHESRKGCGCCNKCSVSVKQTTITHGGIDKAFMTCFQHRPYLCAYGCFDCKVPVCLKCTKQEHNKHTICELFELTEESTVAKSDPERLYHLRDLPSKDSVTGSEIQKGYKVVRTQAKEQAKVLHSIIDEILQETLNSANEMEFRDLEYVERIEKELNISKLNAEHNNFSNHANLNAEEIIYQRDEEGFGMTSAVSEPKFRAPRFLEGKPNNREIKAQFGILKPSIIDRRKQKERKLMSKANLLFDIDSRSKYTLYVRFYHSNRILQSGTGPELYIFNEEGECVDTVQTKSGHGMPTGLAVMNDGTILYTEYSYKLIRKIKSDKSVENLRQTEGKPNGICCTRSDDIIVCLQDCPQGKVVRLDRTGNMKREFEHEFLKDPTAVCENINNDICITEESMRNVIVTDVDFDTRFMYDGNLKLGEFKKFTPRDICCDSFGHILIADFSNRVIHMIDENGHFIRYLLTKEDGLSYPHGLCVDGEDRLWVAERFSKKIKVFQYLSS
ncbi:uncharacterized protein LOC133184470 [Saccostrea echinata]|uniref:uncharacterized protein LOC133184470 n=1 Tax=Saccostrea echinata TaxID=191078 RepID=UPI002A7F4AC3|nr:uncharacterized protein LOC133184470 [Saccostrea echinata]